MCAIVEEQWQLDKLWSLRYYFVDDGDTDLCGVTSAEMSKAGSKG
jgi:hypothetical protein